MASASTAPVPPVPLQASRGPRSARRGITPAPPQHQGGRTSLSDSLSPRTFRLRELDGDLRMFSDTQFDPTAYTEGFFASHDAHEAIDRVKELEALRGECDRRLQKEVVTNYGPFLRASEHVADLDAHISDLNASINGLAAQIATLRDIQAMGMGVESPTGAPEASPHLHHHHTPTSDGHGGPGAEEAGTEVPEWVNDAIDSLSEHIRERNFPEAAAVLRSLERWAQGHRSGCSSGGGEDHTSQVVGTVDRLAEILKGKLVHDLKTRSYAHALALQSSRRRQTQSLTPAQFVSELWCVDGNPEGVCDVLKSMVSVHGFVQGTDSMLEVLTEMISKELQDTLTRAHTHSDPVEHTLELAGTFFTLVHSYTSLLARAFAESARLSNLGNGAGDASVVKYAHRRVLMRVCDWVADCIHTYVARGVASLMTTAPNTAQLREKLRQSGGGSADSRRVMGGGGGGGGVSAVRPRGLGSLFQTVQDPPSVQHDAPMTPPSLQSQAPTRRRRRKSVMDVASQSASDAVSLLEERQSRTRALMAHGVTQSPLETLACVVSTWLVECTCSAGESEAGVGAGGPARMSLISQVSGELAQLAQRFLLSYGTVAARRVSTAIQTETEERTSAMSNVTWAPYLPLSAHTTDLVDERRARRRRLQDSGADEDTERATVGAASDDHRGSRSAAATPLAAAALCIELCAFFEGALALTYWAPSNILEHLGHAPEPASPSSPLSPVRSPTGRRGSRTRRPSHLVASTPPLAHCCGYRLQILEAAVVEAFVTIVGAYFNDERIRHKSETPGFRDALVQEGLHVLGGCLALDPQVIAERVRGALGMGVEEEGEGRER